MTANQYADAEEAEVRFNKDAGTHRPTRHSDDRPDDRRHNDRRYDDRSYHRDVGRDRLEGSKSGQNHRRWPEHIVTTVNEPRAKRNYDEAVEEDPRWPVPSPQERQA